MSWSFVSPQKTPIAGSREHPSVRYSAAAVSFRGEMFMTHGCAATRDSNRGAFYMIIIAQEKNTIMTSRMVADALSPCACV